MADPHTLKYPVIGSLVRNRITRQVENWHDSIDTLRDLAAIAVHRRYCSAHDMTTALQALRLLDAAAAQYLKEELER